VEADHEILGQKYQLLPHTLDNRIACFLNNTFGERLNSDIEVSNEIIQQIKSRQNMKNSLAEKVEAQN